MDIILQPHLEHGVKLAQSSAEEQKTELQTIFTTLQQDVDIRKIKTSLGSIPYHNKLAQSFYATLKYKITDETNKNNYYRMAKEEAGLIFDMLVDVFSNKIASQTSNFGVPEYSDIIAQTPKLAESLNKLKELQALLLPYITVPEKTEKGWFNNNISLLWAIGREGLTDIDSSMVSGKTVTVSDVNSGSVFWRNKAVGSKTATKPTSSNNNMYNALITLFFPPGDQSDMYNSTKYMNDKVYPFLRKHAVLRKITAAEGYALTHMNLLNELSICVSTLLPEADIKLIFKQQNVPILQGAINDMVASLTDCSGQEIAESVSRYSINSHVSNIINTFSSNPAVFRENHMNILLLGPPGSGKSRYSDIIARVLKGLGLLINQKPFKTISAQNLIGEYVGQTGPKTRKELDSSIENVLFIDEAYMLAKPEKFDSAGKITQFDVFGSEAIAEIVNFLDKRKGQISVICAGYVKEMTEHFMVLNPGIPRRFPIQIFLSPYTPEELAAIFCFFMAKLNLHNTVMPETVKLLKEIFKASDDFFPNSSGDVENLSAIASKALTARRVVNKNYKLTPYDLSAILRSYCMTSKGEICAIVNLPEGVEYQQHQPNVINNPTHDIEPTLTTEDEPMVEAEITTPQKKRKTGVNGGGSYERFRGGFINTHLSNSFLGYIGGRHRYR